MPEKGGSQKLTLVSKSAEEVRPDHLYGSLQHTLLNDIISCLWLVKYVNYLDEALLLRLL